MLSGFCFRPLGNGFSFRLLTRGTFSSSGFLGIPLVSFFSSGLIGSSFGDFLGRPLVAFFGSSSACS